MIQQSVTFTSTKVRLRVHKGKHVVDIPNNDVPHPGAQHQRPVMAPIAPADTAGCRFMMRSVGQCHEQQETLDLKMDDKDKSA